ncbi:ScbA/BarX family gamma-butyrolactone biosynthesis protein [Streptomyces cahuitamycinicus]|uniref:Transcriptional regulator n=1 Tax=Streptomyces cahuitamycinicus TaxID=2070367 RepID=A0A2N8TWY1_9ACTN|nr:ScbA/BarX family gamma-butyrolactone biosynthesis protein [Streptomyces cahuitamycinicus]PNG23526.1 transcriptional regulator [Streptomyces cahuitamycinicus]
MLVPTERPVSTPNALTTTVPKEYVHRAALAEVFLTDWTTTSPDTFTITAQWPRCHGFYASAHGLYDPMLLSETVRQASILLSHAGYGVPFGQQVSWSRFQYTVNPDAMRIELTPAELRLEVTCAVRYRRELPAAFTMHFQILRGASLLGEATTVSNCHPTAVYKRLRGGRDVGRVFAEAPQPTPPLPGADCGRDRLQDVVLSPCEQPRRWQLRVDTMHPVLFDHPVDHIPGMLLLEAARQAAHAAPPSGGERWPVSMEVAFHRYVELNTPCWITADPVTSQLDGHDKELRIQAIQGDGTAFTARIAVAHVSGGTERAA